jgi:hypothetical protein
MNLNCGPLPKWWMKMQEHLGNVVLDIGDEALEENLKIEIRVSLLNDQGKRYLSVAGDIRWDKLGSWRKYG